MYIESRRPNTPYFICSIQEFKLVSIFYTCVDFLHPSEGVIVPPSPAEVYIVYCSLSGRAGPGGCDLCGLHSSIVAPRDDLTFGFSDFTRGSYSV